MNNKEIKDFTQMISNNSKLHVENEDKIKEIISACAYSTKRDEEFAKKIQGCIKYFYKEPLKEDFGTFDEQSSYIYQISKRGMGTKYHYSTNMDLITSFLKSETRYSSGGENKKSFEAILDDDEIYKKLLLKLNDEGKKFFDDLKAIRKKYKLQNVSGHSEKNITIPEELKSFIGEDNGNLKMSFNDSCITIIITDKGKQHSFYSRGKEIFSSSEKTEDLEIKILQVNYKEEIEAFINETKIFCEPHLKEWKGFETEFNQLVAKYAMVSII